MLRPYTSTEPHNATTSYWFNGTEMYKFANSSSLPHDPVVVTVNVSTLYRVCVCDCVCVCARVAAYM